MPDMFIYYRNRVNKTNYTIGANSTKLQEIK